MARHFTRASSDFISLPVRQWANGKFFAALWFRLASLPSSGTVYTFVSVTNGNLINHLFAIKNVSGAYKLYFRFTAGIFHEAYLGPITAPVVGEWHHAAVLCDASTNPDSIQMWLDNAALTVAEDPTLSGLTDQMPGYTGCNESTIGGWPSQSGFYFDGDLAELIVTTDNWTTDEIAALSKGFSPMFFKPLHTNWAYRATDDGQQGYYYPLTGRQSNERDPLTGSQSTAVSGTAFADHPRVFYPFSRGNQGGVQPPPDAPQGFTRRRAFRGLEGPLYWSKLAHRDTDGTPKNFPWAPISIADPASYYDGFKEERILSVGDIAFPLSDRNGLVQVPTCDVTYSDLPGRTGLMLLRGLLGNDAQKALKFKEFTIYCTTDEDRRAGATPAIVFRGYVDRCDGDPEYQFTIHAKGWIARRLSEALWSDTIADLFPEAPADSLVRSAPIAFGHLSDEGSVAGPIVFVDDEAGRGGHGGSPNPISSYGDIATPPTGLVASEAVGLGNINLGDNPGDAYYVQVTRVVAGVESDPMPFLPESITPVVITADAAAIDATCDADGADSYRFYIGRIFTGQIAFSHYLETADPVTGVRFTDYPTLASQAATPITAGGKFAVNPFAYVAVAAVMTDGSRTTIFPGEFPVLGVVRSLGYNRPVRFAITPLAGVDYYEFYFRRHPTNPFDKRFIVPTTQTNGNGDVYWEYDWSTTGYEVIAGAPVPSGVLTPIHCGKFTDLVGYSDWDGFLISARPCWEFEAAYLNSVRIDETRYGVDIVAPGKPGYATRFGALPFSANGYSPTMIFTLGPLTEQILGLNGVAQQPFRVNVKGHANVGGTDVETSIYELLRMLAKNVVLTDAPSIKGDFDQEPVFTDNTPRLDDISLDQAAFDALQVIPNGPDAARWLPGDLTVDEFFQDICPSGKLKVGIKPNGQMVAAVHNPYADVVDTLEEQFDVVDRSFKFQVSDQGFANATPYEYGTHYDETGALVMQSAAPAEDAVSQSSDQYGARVPDDPWSFGWRRSAGLAAGVARALLEESRYQPQPADVDGMLHLLQRAPGETVAVTHRQGATATGYTARKHAVLGMRIALGQYTVGFTLLDLRTNVGELSFFQSEDFMAGRWIGGARNDVCQTLGGVTVPYNSFTFVIDWDEIPGTHGQRARIFSAVSGGGGRTIKPSIFLEGEDPSGDTAVVEGVNMTSATFDEQLLVIPRGSGEVRYWLLPILGGGAAAGDASIFGFLEGYRL